MKEFLKRLNFTLLVISIFFGIYCCIFYSQPWSMATINEKLLGGGHGKGLGFSFSMILLIPSVFCFLSSFVSWLFGKGFKFHYRIK